MEGVFLEIHRSKLELDPCGDRGQPSIWSITHCVFLFGVRKDALNRLRTQGIGCFAERGMADILFVFFDRYESAYFRNGVKRKATSKPRGARKNKQAL